MNFKQFMDKYYPYWGNDKNARIIDYGLSSVGHRLEFVSFIYNKSTFVVIHDKKWKHEDWYWEKDERGRDKEFKSRIVGEDKESFRLDTPNEVLYFNSYDEIDKYLTDNY